VLSCCLVADKEDVEAHDEMGFEDFFDIGIYLFICLFIYLFIYFIYAIIFYSVIF
jgi:hypothetical protein